MKFRCRVFDRSGTARQMEVEASSPADAAEMLRRDGLYPAGIEAVEAPIRRAPSRGWRGQTRLLTSFMRQLAVLVSTGTPLVDALQALEAQADDRRWRDVLADVRTRVEEGSPLSGALEAHPECFDRICGSLVRAGETGGCLDAMLQRLADLTQRQYRLRQTLLGAMVYPCLLVAISVVVLGVMLVFVMPRFAGLFETLDMPLPTSTRVLLSLSGLMVSYWWALLGALAAGGTALVVWARSPAGAGVLHGLLLRLPQIGRVCRGLATARISRLLGLLLESQVPVLEAMDLTRAATGNVHYAAMLARARDALVRGETLSSALGATPLLDPTIVHAVRNGERAGKLGTVLTALADFLDEENEAVIRAATSLIEPLILMVLGVLVGGVAVSMFLPLFDLTTVAGGGGVGP